MENKNETELETNISEDSKNNKETKIEQFKKSKIDTIQKDQENKEEVINENKEKKSNTNKNVDDSKPKSTSQINDPLNKPKTKNMSDNKQIFFFTSLINNYTITSIQFFIVEGKKLIPLNQDNFTYVEESYSNYNKTFKLFYFKLNPGKNNSFYFRIYYYNNKSYYSSEEIKILKGNYILGHIKLYHYRYYVDQIYFKNEQILYQNEYLLKKFKSDKIYMKYAIEKYRPENNINLNDILKIMEICTKYECIPLFLKDININNILNQNSYNISFNLENNSMFNKLGDIISKVKSKDDEKNENQKKCYFFLLEFYAWVYYKFNRKKFIELINSGDFLFRASLSRLISNKIIKIKDLQTKYNINQEIIIPLIIENSSSFDELKNIFLNYNNILDALNSVNIYYELINQKLNNQNKDSKMSILPWNWGFFSSGKIEILLPDPSEKDDIDSIYNLQRSILEKEENNNSKNEIIDFKKILSKLIEINEKAQNLSNLIKLKEMINHLKEKGKDIKRLNEKLNDAIHDSGIYLSLVGKYSNKGIINFIKNDEYYKLDKYEQSSKRDQMFSNILIFLIMIEKDLKIL